MWEQPLNSVIGDAGLVARFGRQPCRHDKEEERIRAHLLHVAELLRQCDGGCLRRSECAALLEAYAEGGRFPKHGREPSRRTPIFVDGRGTPCAVAHLMRETGAGELCEAVDAGHHHGYVAEMALPGAPLAPEIAAWAASVGLSTRELATIQPGYTAEQKRGLACAYALLLAGALASFALAVSGLADLWLWRWRGLPMSPSQCALAALGALQCLLLPPAFAEETPCLSRYRAEWPKRTEKTLGKVVYFSGTVNGVYAVVAGVSLPLGLALLAVISLRDAPVSQSHDLQGLCKVTWIVLAAIGVLYVLATALVLLWPEPDGSQRGKEESQRRQLEKDLTSEDTSEDSEWTRMIACC